MLLAALLSVGCTLGFWLIALDGERREVLSLSRGIAAAVRAETAGRLETLSESIRFLSVRATAADDDGLRAWGAEARFVMERFPEVSWIEWLGAGTGPGARITRADLDPALLPVDDGVEPAPLAVIRGTVVTRPIPLAGGAWAFRIETPLPGEPAWLGASIRLDTFFEKALTEEARRNHVVVTGPMGVAYESRNPPSESPLLRRPLFDGDPSLGWFLSVSPSARFAESARSPLPAVTLVLGTLLTLLLVLLVRSASKERERTFELAELNAELELRVRRRTADLESTNRKLAAENERRRQVQDHLASVNENLRRFGGFVSHELRRPLSAVGAWLEVLARSPALRDRAEDQQHADRARAEVERMARMIDRELALARAVRGALPTTSVSLRPLLREIVAELEARDALDQAVIESDDLPQVLGDRDQLKQLFANLVENSLKYRRADVVPHLALRLAPVQPDESWEILVSDNGRGIDPSRAERLFDAFHRGTASDAEGSGIGLAVCRRIAEQHGGAIWAEGEPGVGTTVHVVLPRAKPREDPSADGKSSDTEPLRDVVGTSVGSTRVLLVEDDESNRDALTTLLSEEGDFEVRACRSGEEAVELARDWRPSVVLLDLTLPGMNGYETRAALADLLSADAVPPPFVALSGIAPEEAATSRWGEFDDHIPKPVPDLPTFAARLRGHAATPPPHPRVKP